MKGKPEAQEWFFFKAGSEAGLKAGPFSWERLLVQAKNGALEPADVVWDPGSGWKKASEVPGLFPAAVSSWTENVHPDALPVEAPARNRSRVYWLSALAAVIVVGVALGLYFGLTRQGEEQPGSLPPTSVSVATSQTTATPQTTVTSQTTATSQTTPSSDTGGAPLMYLGERDSGHQVWLHVGDRVRIDLKDLATSEVAAVSWDYRGAALVNVTGSGSDVAGGVVRSTWLELQAAAVGKATVRAVYSFPGGASRVNWVIYLSIEE